MRSLDWWRLLAKNRFRISLRRVPMAMGVTAFTPINDFMAALQWVLYGTRLNRTEMEHDPIFILGHWRSGTTFLHELMVTNPEFASPNTFQCFAPSHHLVSEYLIVRFGGFLLPKKRPMDDMPAGWTLPQEDEFGLMNLGAPSPYEQIVFPRSPLRLHELLTLEKLSADDKQRWRSALIWFLKTLTIRYDGRRIILKSPTHTARLAELANLFPKAKFIHLTRDPRKLFVSTIRLWKSLGASQSLQDPPDDQILHEYVSKCLKVMYEEFQHAQKAVDPARMIDVRYEDLIAEPTAVMRNIYQHLDLGGFEAALPFMEERLQNHSQYQTNRYELDTELEQHILTVWKDYAQRYGYV